MRVARRRAHRHAAGAALAACLLAGCWVAGCAPETSGPLPAPLRLLEAEMPDEWAQIGPARNLDLPGFLAQAAPIGGARFPGRVRVVEMPMFLGGDPASRDSRVGLLAPTGSLYRLRVDVPVNAVLRTSTGYALLPEAVGRPVRFLLTLEPEADPADAEDPEGSGGAVLIDQNFEVGEHDGWTDFEIDLAPWAGRSVVLTFRSPADDRSIDQESVVWGAWAAPEIVAVGEDRAASPEVVATVPGTPETGTSENGDTTVPGTHPSAPPEVVATVPGTQTTPQPTVPGTLRWDVLLLSLDTLRADRLGAYGYDRRPTSPNLDRLAAGGIVFETAVSQSPWTRPSHKAIMSGLFPASNSGYLTVPLARRLWQRGWRTGALTGGGQVDARFGFHDGFEEYKVQYWNEDIDAVRAWYDQHAGRRTFLFLHTFATHDPYTDARFARAEGISPGRIDDSFDTAVWNALGKDLTDDEKAWVDALYDGGIAALDESLGALFDWMDATGRLDHTIIVVTSDHGEELFEHGGWRHGGKLFDHQLLVPLIVHLPPGLRAELGLVDDPGAGGVRIADQARSVDIVPTLLDLLGLYDPAVDSGRVELRFQGRSLRPLLAGSTMAPATAFAENVNIQGYERKAFRTDRWKLVWQTPTGATAHLRDESAALYDLRSDPGETTDIADQHPDAVAVQLEQMRRLVQGAGELEEEAPEGLDADLIERLRSLGYVD